MDRRALAIWVVSCTLLGLALAQCAWAPPLYWGKTIRGRVVDRKTGQPIDGAVVIADWKLYGGGVGHGGHRDSLFVQDTATGADGRFELPAWGPVRRPSYRILDRAPWLIVFKSGYVHRALWNERKSNGFVRRSEWDGKTVELSKFTGPAKLRVEQLELVFMISALQPRLIREILKERPLYCGEAPAFFDHLQSLLASSPRNPS